MTKTTLSKETIAYIKKETGIALEKANEGMSIRDNLKNIYLGGLPDKTDLQAGLMADEILDKVTAFDDEVIRATQSYAGWLDNRLAEMVSGKTLEEQYDLAFKFLTTVSLMQAQVADYKFTEDESIQEFLSQVESGKISKSDLTEEDVQELITKIKEALKNSPAIFSGYKDLAEMLENEIDIHEVTAHSKKVYKEKEYRAVASMICYVGCKSGNIKGVPVDMTAAQITYEVCAAMESAEIIKKAETGLISWETAKTLLKIVAEVFFFYTALQFAKAGAFIGAIMTGHIIGVFIGAGLAAWLFMDFHEVYGKIVDGGLEVAKTAAIFTFVMFKKGISTVSAWALEIAIPSTVSFIKSLIIFIKQKIADGVAVVNETVKQQSITE